MATLKGVALWIVAELQVWWCVVNIVVTTLVYRILCLIPSLKARITADFAQRHQMPPFPGNWQVYSCEKNLSN